MENDRRPGPDTEIEDDEDERDDAVIAADDTGMLSNQRAIDDEEIREHTEPTGT